MKFDFQQGKWRSQSVKHSESLGISKSGRFGVYEFFFVPDDLTRKEMRLPIPPTDNFFLNYCDRHIWERTPLKLPLALSQAQELVEVSTPSPMPNYSRLH